MSQEIYFSIIIPTYNRQELIVECINKMKNQSFNNWECIIINDGSTDNTKEIVRQSIEKDARFTLINQENSERAIARNNGAKLAIGKYMIFLDSDDYFGSNHLENLHREIKNEGESIAMYFSNAHKVEDNIEEVVHKQAITKEEINFTFFLNNAVVPARVCIHRSILNELEFDPRAIIVEDTILWLEIVNKYPVIYIPLSSVYYVVHGTNSVNINFNNAYLQRLIGLKILFYKKSIGKKIPATIQNTNLNRCFLGIYEYYYLKNKHLLALFWLIKSLIYYPNIEYKHKIKRLFTLSF